MKMKRNTYTEKKRLMKRKKEGKSYCPKTVFLLSSDFCGA